EQLFPSTVFDVVLTGRYPHSPLKYTRRDLEITAEVLAMMELDVFARRPFNRLSGGEQQQVCIARALAQEADILLFDEPTNNLDLKHQLQIMRLIRKLAGEKNITSILAIHDLNFAAAYSDRIIVLHGGRVFANGTPVEVFTREVIREAFGVEAKIYDHHGVPHIAVVHH
ncbi:MAG: ABC transporter ATP-binding protein, partial [Chitinispirillaceae bacterium]|nr:ABC transporter ATP-binding protein [Chitinispirillaceae bacterium]